MSLFVDDPTPTTGGPVEYELPDGCVCHIREVVDRGDVYVAPPEGCQVHTPWAFAGYSLTQEAAVPSALLGVVPDVAAAAEVSPCGEGCECRGVP